MTAVDAAPPLSSRLREETRAAHVRAERSGIMRRLLRGDIDRATYGALLGQLVLLYTALEEALDRRRDHPLVAPFALDTLRRLPALRADVAALGAMTPHGPATHATAAYVARVHAAAEHEPARLVAHAYVRYLGDLSGGRILAGIVRRALAVDGSVGTAFYDFAPHDADRLRRDFRAALDALPLDGAGTDALVDEALAAFALHEALFVELQARA